LRLHLLDSNVHINVSDSNFEQAIIYIGPNWKFN